MDEAARQPGSGHRVLQGLAAAVILIAGLKLGAPILIPISFALFLAVLSFPLFRWQLDHRAPAWFAALVTVLVLLAGIGLFGVLILGSLSELRQTGPAYYQSIQERIDYTFEWWQGKGVAIENWIPPRWQDPQTMAALIARSVRGVFVLLSETTIVLLLLVFLLGEAAAFPARLARLPEKVQDGFRQFTDVSRELQRYLVIKTLMSATVGAAVGAWVAWLGIEFAVLWGLVAFACHFIPNIGAVLAAAPAMAVALVQFDATKAVAVAAGYFAIGLLLGNLAEPALLGRRLGLSTLVVFVSLVFWGWLWGPVGMFLSVPLTMALRIVLAHSREWAWVASLLGGPPRSPVQPQGAPVDSELAAEIEAASAPEAEGESTP